MIVYLKANVLQFQQLPLNNNVGVCKYIHIGHSCFLFNHLNWLSGWQCNFRSKLQHESSWRQALLNHQSFMVCQLLDMLILFFFTGLTELTKT